MIKKESLKNRNLYLNQLIGFQGTEFVKMITGIRRCGKASLMKLMISHLAKHDIPDSQIVVMNFDSMEFRGMDAVGLYECVKNKILPDKKCICFSMKFRECLIGRMELILLE